MESERLLSLCCININRHQAYRTIIKYYLFILSFKDNLTLLDFFVQLYLDISAFFFYGQFIRGILLVVSSREAVNSTKESSRDCCPDKIDVSLVCRWDTGVEPATEDNMKIASSTSLLVAVSYSHLTKTIKEDLE
jgi:hypothetical protein